MNIVKIVLYVLFVLSVVAPIYTYAVYPFVLKIFKRKKYVTDNLYKPQVSVAIFSDGSNEEEKIRNLKNCDYPMERLDITVVHNILELNEFVFESKSDLILFTDTKTEFEKKAISILVSRFADERIGCVNGLLRKKPDKHGKPTDGTLWKYENKVKRLESSIGRFSGANSAIYAVKKSILPKINKKTINIDFYISTYVLKAGWDIIITEDAVAYEPAEKADVTNFEKHIRDGAGYYQALAIFWRMLFPHKGSFTYVSHRVIKWLVPFNMIYILVVSMLFAFQSIWMCILLFIQILLYALLLHNHFFNQGVVGRRLSSVGCYFLLLNVAYFYGFLKLILSCMKEKTLC